MKQHKVTAHLQLLWICLTSMLVPSRSGIAPLRDGNSQLWERFHKASCFNGFILVLFPTFPSQAYRNTFLDKQKINGCDALEH